MTRWAETRTVGWWPTQRFGFAVCFPWRESPLRCATVSVVVSRCGLPRFLQGSAALMVDLAPLPGGAFRVSVPVRRATDDASAALSGGLAANALSPFSPKWRATGVRSASPHDGPDLAPLPGGAFSCGLHVRKSTRIFWETERCLASCWLQEPVWDCPGERTLARMLAA